MQFLRNESQEARAAYENLLKSSEGGYVNATGDTMTGNLIVPTVTITSLVSGARFQGKDIILSSLASIRRVESVLYRGINQVLTSIASIARVESPYYEGIKLNITSLISAARVKTLRADTIHLNVSSLASIARVGGKVEVWSDLAGPAIDFNVSGPSGTVFKIGNIEQGYVSTNSTATISFAMRVDIGGTIYYMPVYLGKA